jgi:hypothetical protein
MESHHREGIQRGHVLLHLHPVHLTLWGIRSMSGFHLHFLNIRHRVSKQHILLIPCHGVGTRSFSQELAISVYVRQVFCST